MTTKQEESKRAKLEMLCASNAESALWPVVEIHPAGCDCELCDAWYRMITYRNTLANRAKRKKVKP